VDLNLAPQQLLGRLTSSAFSLALSNELVKRPLDCFGFGLCQATVAASTFLRRGRRAN
jgi:hypothetical protein